MKSWRFGAIAILLILGLSIIPEFCSGEGEPNDSLDQAEILDEDWTYGFVSMEYGDEGETDMDFFKVDLPPRSIVVITLKKVDPHPYWSIFLESFNQYKELDDILWKMDSRDSYYDDNDMVVDVPGSEVRGCVVGSELDSVFYLKVYGRGNYSIKTKVISSPDLKDNPFDVVTEYLSLGTANGIVYEMEYESIQVFDIDQFWTHFNMSNFRIRLERMDESEGRIFLKVSDYYRVPELDDVSPTAVLSDNLTSFELVILYDSYENTRYYDGSDYWYHYGDEDFYINIWGDGKYRVTVEILPLLKDGDDNDYEMDDDDPEGDDTKGDEIYLIFSILGICQIISFLVILMLIIAIIVISPKKKKNMDDSEDADVTDGKEGKKGDINLKREKMDHLSKHPSEKSSDHSSDQGSGGVLKKGSSST